MAIRKAPKTLRHGGAGLIDVNDEDLSFAVARDQFNCAIVRSIQRKIPEALYVRVNQKKISFTMPNDKLADAEELGVRYHFDTPTEAVENIIRPLDTGGRPEPFSFVLGDAFKAVPMKHSHPGRAEGRQESRIKRADRVRRNASKSPAVRTYERFQDVVLAEATDDNS